jgi:hypothetical protein
MNIYDFIEMINDTDNIIFKVFDCNSGNCVFLTDDEDDVDTEFTYEELRDSKYADIEFGSMDMWMDIKKGKMFIEFNVDIEIYEDEEEWDELNG